MCDIPDVSSPEVIVKFHIEAYGPQRTRAGESFNAQPDGSSAAWFRVDKDLSGTEVKVHLGSTVVPGDISGNLVTVKVPLAVHSKPGLIPVVLEIVDGVNITKSDSVTITVDSQ
ncbi:hypothetical protein [Luteibacter sp. UNCMF366Tsu5.1]|uniref:hypothetical protein n=1 Tax=Luteibacter sp. UNCMF366Tsu5.1 TaxID=1502758 RepID=UPI0011602AB3|nr:hypothetical protein [Luteibacter sp. UNCMF366Tsu5.1]